MDSGDALQLGVLVILIALSAFFSSAETALTTVNRIRLLSLAEQGDKRAERVLKIKDNTPKMLSAILIGNNIVNLSASSLSTTLTIRLFGNAAVGVATGVITLLILIFGEITPKSMASYHAESMALAYSTVIHVLIKILTPVIWVVNLLSGLVLKLGRVDATSQTNAMTEYELRTIVDVSHENGVIESDERQMIYNVFDFGDSQAKDIMVPRVDMVCIDIDSSYDEILEVFREEHFTRLPVYEENPDNVVGIINVKDLLLLDSKDTFCVKDVMREPYFTYEYKKTSELMVEMRQDSINLTIVLDEYGATVGMITLEDLLEEIVGEIRDEYDEDEEELIQRVNDYEYIVSGSLKLDDLNDALGLSLTSEDYDSVGGYIIEHLDHLPKEQEFVVTDGIRLVVDSVDKKRIHTVHIYLPEREASPSPEESEPID